MVGSGVPVDAIGIDIIWFVYLFLQKTNNTYLGSSHQTKKINQTKVFYVQFNTIRVGSRSQKCFSSKTTV